MADTTKNNRRWMRRGAKAWFYNYACSLVPELVTLIRKDGKWWVVSDENKVEFSIDADSLFPEESLAYRAYRESAYRGYAAAKRRLEEIDAHIAELEKSDG